MQLNQKITCIGNVVECGKDKGEKSATSPESVTELKKMKSVAVIKTRPIRRPLKRAAPAFYKLYGSDWNSDTEDEGASTNYQPQQKKQVSCRKSNKFLILYYKLLYLF